MLQDLRGIRTSVNDEVGIKSGRGELRGEAVNVALLVADRVLRCVRGASINAEGVVVGHVRCQATQRCRGRGVRVYARVEFGCWANVGRPAEPSGVTCAS
jgi:hypothetical protein